MIYEHIEGVEVTAQFSWENDMRYRYRLEIVLKDTLPNGKTACVVMQNPSYAGEDVADKSVQFMEKVTTALFAKDSEVDIPNVFKAARHGGGADDFSVIALTGTPQPNRLHFLQFHQRLVG